MAVGATPSSILRLIAVGTARFVGAGFAAGVAGALLLTRVIQSLLFGVSPWNPAAWFGAAAVMAAVAAAACAVPALRAARVDPARALAAE
jgi:ABC-type antimicrobial peptide transport system permease subunit